MKSSWAEFGGWELWKEKQFESLIYNMSRWRHFPGFCTEAYVVVSCCVYLGIESSLVRRRTGRCGSAQESPVGIHLLAAGEPPGAQEARDSALGCAFFLWFWHVSISLRLTGGSQMNNLASPPP